MSQLRGWTETTIFATTRLVVLTRRLYQVPAHYIAAADKRHLDFGHCLLRLPDKDGLPTL